MAVLNQTRSLPAGFFDALGVKTPELISEGTEFLVFKANEDGGKAVVVKTPIPGADPQHCERLLRNEFSISKSFDLEGVRKALSYKKVGRQPVLTLEYTAGITFRKIASAAPIPISQWLHMAIGGAEILRRLHLDGYVHQDVSGENFLLDPESGRMSLIDLMFASKAGDLLSGGRLLDSPVGTLPYISPELTGRIELPVDRRSDLYSYGMVLFELATGVTPFRGEDAISLIHCHIAETCPDPCKLRPDFPRALADIILKLAAKNPEARYQSAGGLVEELRRCLKSLEETGSTGDWQAGSLDIPFALSISSKLYGRAADLDKLLSQYHEAAEGKKKIVVLNGKSGTGKSRLVSALMDELRGKKGLSITGKADQISGEAPFLAFRKAMDEWMAKVMTESNESLAAIRTEVQLCLGSNGSLLLNLLPSLERLTGPLADVASTGLEEDKNRFNYAFRDFFRCTSQLANPLVVFLDDLQWADSGTLNLVRQMAYSREEYPLLLILSSRTEEIALNKSWRELLDELRRANHISCEISLGELAPEDLLSLVADTLRCPPDEAKPLASLIHQKTQGNVYFAVEFLSFLGRNGHLQYDNTAGKWIPLLEGVANLNATENVVQFLSEKIRSLPSNLRKILSFGSCLGSSFTASMIASAGGFPLDRTEEELRLLVEENVLDLSGGVYSFPHDRVQQAAHGQLSEADAAEFHLSIAQNLSKLDGTSQDAHFLETASHYLQGRSAIKADHQRVLIAEVFLLAGNNAKRSLASKSALEFFQAGIEMIGQEGWTLHRGLMQALHDGCAESAFLMGETELVFDYANRIMSNALSSLDKCVAVEVLNLVYMRDGRYKECLDSALPFLKELGVTIPSNPGKLSLLLQLVKVEMALRKKPIPTLSSLPQLKRQEVGIAQRMFPSFAPAAYLSRPSLLSFLLVKNLALTLEYGRGPEFPVALYYYAVIKCGILGNTVAGKQLADMALQEVEKPESRKYFGLVNYGLAILVYPWFRPMKHTIEQLETAYEVSLKNGDLVAASSSLATYLNHELLSGSDLFKVMERGKVSVELLRDYKQEFPLNLSLIYLQVAQNLMETVADPLVLNGDFLNRTQLSGSKAMEDKTILATIPYCELILCLIHMNFEEGAKRVPEGLKYLENIVATYAWGIFPMLQAICELRTGKMSLGKAQKVLGKLQKFAKNSPANYAGKAFLVEAEIWRKRGKVEKAIHFYELAIQHERDNDSSLFEALSLEFKGRYQLELNMRTLAMETLSQSLNVYSEWGAESKAAAMAKELQAAGLDTRATDFRTDFLSGSISGGRINLDVETVLKASEVISNEVDIEKLMERLLRFTAENAGATRALFLLPEGADFVPYALLEGGEVQGVQQMDASLSTQDLVPVRVIQYALRMEKTVIGPQDTALLNFAQDPYFLTRKVLSYLCLPLFNQGKAVAVLYMENDLVHNAFSRERVELLRMLSGQISISIENALLVRNLEQKVAERTREILHQKTLVEQEKSKSDELLRNILPEETAEELKATGRAIARSLPEVTVLFADIVSFTTIAQDMGPEALVEYLDECFRGFDSIMEEFSIEKIKTIGDAYMCASGLPVAHPDHAIRMVGAALKMMEFMQDLGARRAADGKPQFVIRIGINSGPVVGGVVGSRKFAYDIWGDTVNTAARLEQNSESNRINISGSTYALVKDSFRCQPRGKLPAKNKGEIEMYFVEGPL